MRTDFPILGAHIRSRASAAVRAPRQWPTPGNRKALAAEKALYEGCDEIIARRGGEPVGDFAGCPPRRGGESVVDADAVISAGSTSWSPRT